MPARRCFKPGCAALTSQVPGAPGRPPARARPSRTAPTPARPARAAAPARASRARSRCPPRPRAPSTSRSRARMRAMIASAAPTTPGHLVGQELGVAHRDERPDAGDDRDAHVLDAARRKRSSCADVEHRLRDRVLGARLHLPLEALELVRGIDRGRDSRRRRSRTRRRADRVAAGIEPAIQVAARGS